MAPSLLDKCVSTTVRSMGASLQVKQGDNATPLTDGQQQRLQAHVAQLVVQLCRRSAESGAVARHLHESLAHADEHGIRMADANDGVASSAAFSLSALIKTSASTKVSSKVARQWRSSSSQSVKRTLGDMYDSDGEDFAATAPSKRKRTSEPRTSRTTVSRAPVESSRRGRRKTARQKRKPMGRAI
jgi:hypothetical protein